MYKFKKEGQTDDQVKMSFAAHGSSLKDALESMMWPNPGRWQAEFQGDTYGPDDELPATGGNDILVLSEYEAPATGGGAATGGTISLTRLGSGRQAQQHREGMTLRDALQGIDTDGMTPYVNSQEATMDQVLQAGDSIVLAGNVKGG